MDDVLSVNRLAHGCRRARVPAQACTGKLSLRGALLSTTGCGRSAPVHPTAAPGERVPDHEGQVPARERFDQVPEGPVSERLVQGGERGERGDHHDLDALVEGLDLPERIEVV